MSEIASDPTQGSIAGFVLARVLQYASARGHDAAAICRSVGLDPAALRAPGARVSYALAERLGAHVEALSGDPNFGLHLGQLVVEGVEQDPGVMAMMASPTVRAALERLARVQRFWGDGPRATLTFAPDGSALFRWKSPVQTELARRHSDECALAEFVAGMRALAGAALSASVVRFRHSPPADEREHHAFFLCPIEWNALHTELSLDARTLDCPMPHAHAHFAAVFERQAQSTIDRLPPSDDLLGRARAAVRSTLSECSLESVARSLALSPRTLQRRLRDAHNTTFAVILDDLRRETAVEALARGASVVEVAAMVGYAESSAFFHAFKRWTGRTPEQSRAVK